MKIKRFKAENFRNIEYCDIEFSDGVNLLYGQNAQGKTNAIEGIYLFSRGKSFRGADDEQMKRYGCEGFRVFIEYEDKNGENTLEYASFGRERLRKKNGFKIKKLSEMIGYFKTVLFYPDNLNLIKEGPEERRNFLNIALSQCYSSYISDYSFYKEALENRNKLLKNASKGLEVDRKEIESWSEIMADYASRIYIARKEYVDKLNKYAPNIHNSISYGKEELKIKYISNISSESLNKNEIEEIYKSIFKNSIEKEILAAVTLYGPQRDDLLIEINGKNSRIYSSQGQQRSAVLSMKLSEGEIINEMFGEYPVFLFDDVLSELDDKRKEYVMMGMRGKQIIITSCSDEKIKDQVLNITEVKEGKYVSSHW